MQAACGRRRVKCELCGFKCIADDLHSARIQHATSNKLHATGFQCVTADLHSADAATAVGCTVQLHSARQRWLVYAAHQETTCERGERRCVDCRALVSVFSVDVHHHICPARLVACPYAPVGPTWAPPRSLQSDPGVCDCR
jgi:hypothetical protein